MCTPGLRARFCTCAGNKPLGYPRWELWRPEPELNELRLNVVGSFMPPPLDYKLLIDRLLQDLNRPDAFDTDLGFRTHDELVLHWREDDWMVFCFDEGRWTESWSAYREELREKRPLAVGLLEEAAGG